VGVKPKREARAQRSAEEPIGESSSWPFLKVTRAREHGFALPLTPLELTHRRCDTDLEATGMGGGEMGGRRSTRQKNRKRKEKKVQGRSRLCVLLPRSRQRKKKEHSSAVRDGSLLSLTRFCFRNLRSAPCRRRMFCWFRRADTGDVAIIADHRYRARKRCLPAVGI